jgi:hypothetical protein
MRVRRAAALATALLTLAVATPARAAGPLAIGASSLGDPVFPTLGNGGYDVQRYALDVTYDGMARVVRGTVRISARTTQPLSRFFLDAAGLDVSAVLVDNVPAAFTVLPEKLQIDPTTPLRAGRAMLVEVRYSADPRRIPQPAGGSCRRWTASRPPRNPRPRTPCSRATTTRRTRRCSASGSPRRPAR